MQNQAFSNLKHSGTVLYSYVIIERKMWRIKTMKKVIAIIVACGFVLLIGVAGVFLVKMYTNPVNRTLMALKNSMKPTESIDATYKAQMKLDIDAYEDAYYELDNEERKQMEFVNIMLNNFVLRGNIKEQVNQKNPMLSKFEYKIDAIYDDEILLNTLTYMDEERFGILIPVLSDLNFVMDKEDIYDELEINIQDFDFEKYTNLVKDQKKLLKKVDEDAYMKIITEFLEEHLEEGEKIEVALDNGETVKCREYILEVELEDLVDVMEDLMKEVEDDEELREYIRLSALAVSEELLDSKDYEMLAMDDVDEDEIETILEDLVDDYLEDEDDFEDFYEMAFEELDWEFDQMKEDAENYEQEFEINYAIDIKNTIRSVSTTILTEEFIEFDVQMVVNNRNGEIEFTNIDGHDAINMMDVAEDESKAEDMIVQLIDDVGVYLTENTALTNLFSDIEENSSMLSEYDQQQIQYFLEMVEPEMIEDLLNEMDLFPSFSKEEDTPAEYPATTETTTEWNEW